MRRMWYRVEAGATRFCAPHQATYAAYGTLLNEKPVDEGGCSLSTDVFSYAYRRRQGRVGIQAWHNDCRVTEKLASWANTSTASSGVFFGMHDRVAGYGGLSYCLETID